MFESSAISPADFERFYQAVPKIIQQVLTDPKGNWGFLGVAVQPDDKTGADQHSLICGNPMILAAALTNIIKHNEHLRYLLIVMLMDDEEILKTIQEVCNFNMDRLLTELFQTMRQPVKKERKKHGERL